MTVEELMQALNIIENKKVTVYVDTEAGTFPCHYVDVEDVEQLEKDIDEGEPCIIGLDCRVMRKVHPNVEADNSASSNTERE
jgi:hypothetical protein